MGECMEQFYNADMVQVMDENKYLLGFENGIYDFEKRYLDKEYQKIMLVLQLKLIMYLLIQNVKNNVALKKK